MTRTAKRVAAATGATVLTLGLATPALAHEPAEGWHRVAEHAPDRGPLSGPSLAEIRARVDQAIGYRLAWLGRAQASVRASDRLAGEQKTALLTRLQAAEDALTALRAKVAAATTVDQVRAALRQSGLRGFLGRGWNHGWRGTTWALWDETRRDADSRDKAGTAKTHRASAAGATRDDDRERARHVRGDHDGDRRAAGHHRGDRRWSGRRDGDRDHRGDGRADGGRHRDGERESSRR